MAARRSSKTIESKSAFKCVLVAIATLETTPVPIKMDVSLMQLFAIILIVSETATNVCASFAKCALALVASTRETAPLAAITLGENGCTILQSHYEDCLQTGSIIIYEYQCALCGPIECDSCAEHPSWLNGDSSDELVQGDAVTACPDCSQSAVAAAIRAANRG